MKTRKPNSGDLPEVKGLRRTGLTGELLSDKGRKEEISRNKKILKESKPASKASGALSAAFGKGQNEAHGYIESSKDKARRNATGRLKELSMTTAREKKK